MTLSLRALVRAGLCLLIAAIALTGLALTTPTQPSRAQGGDPDGDLLQRAVIFLASQLKTEIRVIDAYSYAPQTFRDGSLDCPQPGVSYMQAVVEGYKYTITFQQKTYDVRISTDGGVIILCGDASAAPLPVGLTSYRGTAFNIAYPTAWTVTERPTDVLFAPGTVPACAQPGMLITALGAISGSQTPDSLIDTFLTTLGPNAVALDIPRLDLKNGRSALYTTLCADNSTRSGRVSVINANGLVFRVVQFAPQEQFTAWADAYLKALGQFSVNVVGGALDTGAKPEALTAPNTAIPAAIYHIFAGNVYRGTLTDLPGLALVTGATQSRGYRRAVPSPDGRFVAYQDVNSNNLYVVQPGQSVQPVQVSGDVATVYAPYWKSARELLFARSDGFYLVDLAVGLTATRITEVDLSADACRRATAVDGISPDRALYALESGSSGDNQTRAILGFSAKTDAIYYSDCNGVGLKTGALKTGAARGAETAPGKVVDAENIWFAQSADGERVLGNAVALNSNKLIIVTVAGADAGNTEPELIAIADRPDQAAFSTDGKSIYYSVVTPTDVVKLDAAFDEQRIRQAFGTFPVEVQVNAVSLHRLALDTKIDAEIYTGNGFGIGRIAPAPDNSGVLFSFIPDARLYAQAFGGNATENELRRQAPKTQVFWLPFGESGAVGRPLIVAVTGEVVWGASGSAPLPTPTGGYTPSVAPTATPEPLIFATASPTRRVRTPPPTNTPIG